MWNKAWKFCSMFTWACLYWNQQEFQQLESAGMLGIWGETFSVSLPTTKSCSPLTLVLLHINCHPLDTSEAW